MPDAVWGQIAAIQAEGGKGSLDDALAKAQQAKQACLALLKESKNILDAGESHSRLLTVLTVFHANPSHFNF